ncbi:MULTISPECIES: 2-amino-4-hydroxy-6-hydroxymethyldihydropteridine diphosphokinase [Corallococcus]|uniref:2-amino-4-hydroxy-6-hydroxymethyldihydropteridine pyrophosphokinase n=1 Tax=Corallococcus exiguus TaxID=83462 RepID=A0A7X4Y8Q3_9BACT|nr:MULTISPECIES: 2-amino-4-hydroxy-6-hydroxymethyldihydropteridine diphosphokinase [Corallococcus]NBC40958.1 2-amino-4-hydroxy-6-hydroxymethyldihydropteridine diphosphokinase [Corallococcus exiguus]RKH25805.1 2-amino-4-hydroxy-6-hydroxymethyldihydropteridine diphosphokinase [Corallococcus sp. CA041A]TNV63108.1 2-amino-4-hydroxy-6-hydroxymethyldihydropteridine diphosphokinase [Corallococcus exiguus]
MSATVYVGLGSNEGDRESHLVAALAAMSCIDAVSVLGCSSLYDSAPVGPAQPRFLNAVVALECDLTPQRLLCILQRIEQDLGRRRMQRWGPRTIDLDILLWDEEDHSVVADANLQVPHLELHKRRFALEPLAELAPDARHPVLGVTVQELLAKLAPQDVRKREALFWPDMGARFPVHEL